MSRVEVEGHDEETFHGRGARARRARSYRGVGKVRAHVTAASRTLKVNRAKRTVKVDMRGLPAGTWAVVIRSKGRPTIKRLYTTCGAGNLTGYNL